jgi:hypothetical protein
MFSSRYVKKKEKGKKKKIKGIDTKICGSNGYCPWTN